MRAHSHHDLVRTLPQFVRDVEDRGREAREMLARLLAVHPHRCAELRFVDPQSRYAPNDRHIEPPPVPEPVPLLPRDAGIRNQCRRGREAPLNTILN